MAPAYFNLTAVLLFFSFSSHPCSLGLAKCGLWFYILVLMLCFAWLGLWLALLGPGIHGRVLLLAVYLLLMWLHGSAVCVCVQNAWSVCVVVVVAVPPLFIYMNTSNNKWWWLCFLSDWLVVVLLYSTYMIVLCIRSSLVMYISPRCSGVAPWTLTRSVLWYLILG